MANAPPTPNYGCPNSSFDRDLRYDFINGARRRSSARRASSFAIVLLRLFGCDKSDSQVRYDRCSSGYLASIAALPSQSTFRGLSISSAYRQTRNLSANVCQMSPLYCSKSTAAIGAQFYPLGMSGKNEVDIMRRSAGMAVLPAQIVASDW